MQPEDPDALARAIGDALSGRRVPDLAAARRYAARYTTTKVAAYYLAIYRGLVSGVRPATPLAEHWRTRRAAAS